jgi:hypothetical protein
LTHEDEILPEIVVAEISGDLNGASASQANTELCEIVADLAKSCAAAGSTMIGHIKANFRSGSELLSVSCTTEDGKVGRKSQFISPVKAYTGVLNVIVYGLDHDDLEQVVEKTMDDFGAKYEIVEQDGECHDPHCTDPMHKHCHQ